MTVTAFVSSQRAALLTVDADVSTNVTGAALLETRYELGRMATAPVGQDEPRGRSVHPGRRPGPLPRPAPVLPQCGRPTESADAGWVRRCREGHETFPRTDPAMIMLVHDGDRQVLGRQPIWPPGRFSILAGFVEAGESAEAAVPVRCSRRWAWPSPTSPTPAASRGPSPAR